MMPIKRSLTLESVSKNLSKEDDKQTKEIENLRKIIEKLQDSQLKLKDSIEHMQVENIRRPGSTHITTGQPSSFDMK
jgi:uncharacterized protein YlxW (UPF0749 family)